MSKDTVKISKAKGRPMLTWVGKRPLTQVKAYPAQLIESFSAAPPLPQGEGRGEGDAWSDWPAGYPHGGLLFHGDNKDVLAHLLAKGFRGKVKLIYIDPPFDSGADYVRKVQLRGATGSTRIDGEEYTLGEQVQYEDIWANDKYLQFMYERLLMMRELMRDDASLYLHCDWRKHHHLRCLLDEIFGSEHFVNEVIWKRTSAHSNTSQGNKSYGSINDVILVVSKSDQYTFNTQRLQEHGLLETDAARAAYWQMKQSGSRLPWGEVNRQLVEWGRYQPPSGVINRPVTVPDPRSAQESTIRWGAPTALMWSL